MLVFQLGLVEGFLQLPVTLTGAQCTLLLHELSYPFLLGVVVDLHRSELLSRLHQLSLELCLFICEGFDDVFLPLALLANLFYFGF